MIFQAVVFEKLVVGEHLVLELNHFGIILVNVVSNNKASVKINHLRDVQLSMCWFVQSSSGLDHLVHIGQLGTFLYNSSFCTTYHQCLIVTRIDSNTLERIINDIQ